MFADVIQHYIYVPSMRISRSWRSHIEYPFNKSFEKRMFCVISEYPGKHTIQFNTLLAEQMELYPNKHVS